MAARKRTTEPVGTATRVEPDQAQVERTYRRRVLDLLALFDISKQLNSLDLSSLVNFFLVTVCGHFGVKKISIFLVEEGHVYLTRSRGHAPPPTCLGDALPRALVESLILAGGPIYADALNQQIVPTALWDDTGQTRPEVIVPVLREKELAGIICVGSKISGERFTGDGMEFLTSLASQACVAIDNARYVERLKRKDEELERAYEDLKTLDRQKDDFIKIASHELNTPLTVVRLTTSILLDGSAGVLSDFQRKLLNQIDQSSERLQEINEDLIHLARSNYDVIQVHRETTHMKRVLDAVRRRVQPLFAKRTELRLKIDMQPRLPAVYLDVKKIVKVFEYLIQNAIKYTPEGRHGEIAVSVATTDDPAILICQVTDQGIGIEKKYHRKVFAPFFELVNSDHRSTDKTRFLGAGLGLGLAIVKDIIETERGAIWIESDGKDKGTTVFFTILTKQAFLNTIGEEFESGPAT